ncbi:MAG: hypothetical protein P8X82_17435 [Gemmatimonadales bacterium]
MKELGWREEVDDSYVSRRVNLTTLASDIVAAILDETLPRKVALSGPAVGPEMFDMKTRRVNLPLRAQSATSSTQKLQRRSVYAGWESRVGKFLRVGNEPIQPLEKSASKLLIRNE